MSDNIMAGSSHYSTDKDRKPTSVAAEILKDAERFGYPVEMFKLKVLEFAPPGNIPAYSEIIKCSEAIMSTQEKLNKIRGDIASYDLCNPYMATHPALIEKKIKRLADELQRLRAITENQTQIQACLQSSNSQSSLPIERKYHKAVLELFALIPKMIEELKETVDNLQWFLKFQPNRNIERISTAVTQTFSQLQYTTKQLREFHQILKKLHDIRCAKQQNSTDDEIQSTVERTSISEWKGQKKLNNKFLDSPFFSAQCSSKKSSKKH
uniref:Uncharacterized protein n=1 Tax=Strigamia maritima TaxID=126957 RepID=T1IH99_STRMM